MDECEGFYLIWGMLKDFRLRNKSLLDWHRTDTQALYHIYSVHPVTIIYVLLQCYCMQLGALALLQKENPCQNISKKIIIIKTIVKIWITIRQCQCSWETTQRGYTESYNYIIFILKLHCTGKKQLLESVYRQYSKACKSNVVVFFIANCSFPHNKELHAVTAPTVFMAIFPSLLSSSFPVSHS